MIVIDASVLIDVLVGAGRGVERIAHEDLAAPHLVDVEIGSALRRMSLAGKLEGRVERRALADAAEIEISRYGHVGLLPRAWELKANMTTYDAMYVALAEALDVPLVTLDRAFTAVPGIACVVEVLAS